MASQFPGDRPPPVPPSPYAPPPAGGGMVGRIQRLILQPKAEWPAIDAQPMTAQGVFTTYAVPLAAIGPVAQVIGQQLFGWGALGIRIHPSLAFSLLTAAKSYVVALVGVWILALVIDALAPSFGSVKNRDQAMKAVVFSATAAWLSQIFLLVPALSFLAIVGLYSLYLFWLGLPLLMRTPPDKAVGYVVVSLIAGAVATAVAAVVIGAVFAIFTPAPTAADVLGGMTISGTAPDGTTGSVDLGKLAAAGQQMQAAAEKTAASVNAAAAGASTAPANGKLVDPAALQAMLPAAVGGFTRTAVESSGGAAAGIGGATAKGTYTSGDQSFELSVTDVGALGSLATLGGALNVHSSKQTATGYEKTSMQNGSMIDEEWDNAAHQGKYTTMVASRFAIAAEGSAPDIGPLKAAVAAIDTGRLTAMGK